MSKIALSGNASGTGTFTIASPNSNSDRTLNLPDNSGTVLTSATTTGFPAGSVLQVVSATTSTSVTTASSTFVDTTLTATITPTSATSKVLVMVNQAGCGKETGNTFIFLRLLRDATEIINFERGAAYTNSTASNLIGACSTAYLDSPATTSAVTYKTQVASGANTSAVFVQNAASGATSVSTITLMEIAA
jgi:hypothetical protein